MPTTSPEALRLEELHHEVSCLRSENKSLLEANEELQASLLSAGVEQGRLLTAGETSLAAELEAMSHDQVRFLLFFGTTFFCAIFLSELFELQHMGLGFIGASTFLIMFPAPRC